MRIVSTLLHVILTLSLVLNGAGLATAHAAGASAETAAPAATQGMPHAEAPCHDAHGGGGIAVEPGASVDHANAAQAPSPDHHPDSECCEGGNCDNACPQPLTAALAPSPVAGLHLRPGSHAQAVPATHAGPHLAHPIRPPIA